MPKILTVFNLQSIHFKPQSASLVLSSAPISATTHLDLLGFKLEKDENMSYLLSKICYLLEKKSSAYVAYKNHGYIC